MRKPAVTAALGRANWWNFGMPSGVSCSWGGGELPTWVCPDQNPGGCNSQTPGCNPRPNLAGMGAISFAMPTPGSFRPAPRKLADDRSKYASSCKAAGFTWVEGDAGSNIVGSCCNNSGKCGNSSTFNKSSGRRVGGMAGLAGLGLALGGVPGLLMGAGLGAIDKGLALGACASQQRNMIPNPGGMGCTGPCINGRCQCWKRGGCACRKG